ncbi:sp110 nuclear body protein isoform X2 [Phyllostomus hastatus]|uniref:sp110 nuclear body protein isoform X2 n=1 Tax=Phyllostomus hastatus TaxID=9423 RepID=UPI001E6854A6|nr:sp110 nuclear body protein isoform X2 [Phyllostomus hastatus]
MVTMTRELKNALREHFIHHKLEISYAIFKPFPFFEGLRDKSFITDKMYMESMEACRNMVPVSKVVHNILTKLEDSFHPALLEMLFSQINLREYPNLNAVLRSFKTVFIPCGRSSTPSSFEAPANPAMRSAHQTLLPLPAPLRRPIPVPKVGEPRAAPQPQAQVLGKQPSPAAPAGPAGPAGPAKDLPRVIQKERITPASHINDEENSQRMAGTPPAAAQVSNDNLTPRTKKKDEAEEIPHVAPAHTPVIINDSPKPKDPKKAQEASGTPPVKKAKKRKRIIWSATKRRHPRKSLPKGTASRGHRVQKKSQSVDQTTETKDDSTKTSKEVTSAKKARTEWPPIYGPEEISDDTSEMDEAKSLQDSSTPPGTPPQIVQDPLDNGSKLSLGKSGEKKKKKKKCSESSSKPKQRKSLPKGPASPGHRIPEKLGVVDQASQRKDDSAGTSRMMTRARRARIECAQTSGPEEKKRKTDVCTSSTKTHQKNIPPEEKPQDETVDLQSHNFPVTCGTVKGVFYLEKMKTGSSGQCIQDEEGSWFTPFEFEVRGKGKKSKNWKRSIRCGGKTLLQLKKEGLMDYPPRMSLEREWQKSDECEVCCRGGQLLCCDTCPRAFHEDCHIPPVEAERSPWSCTFCRVKESPGSQPCHGASEVPARPMGPEEQLKCEFILLKTYCHPQSTFFSKIPYNILDYSEPFKESMWLDLVKERLTEKVYTVAWFIRDMRLIFHNHKTFHKASDFGQVGLDLETEFEKAVKDMFIFHETKEKRSQDPP